MPVCIYGRAVAASVSKAINFIIGVANHLEIWSKDRWEALEEEQSASFEEAAEHLSEIMG